MNQLVEDRRPRIGGWLIVPAIGLVLGLTGNVIYLVLLALGRGVGADFNFYALVFVFQAFAVMVFFERSHDAPKFIIGLLFFGAFVATVLYDAYTAVALDIYAAIWIPYFRFSKRVAATFVRAESPENQG